MILLCGLAEAHSLLPVNMTDGEEREFTQTIGQLQVCFSRVDQEAIEQLQKRSNQFATDLRSLCFSGKRGEAEKESMAFYSNMMDIDTVKQVKACGDEIPPSLKPLLSIPLDLSQFERHEGRHICDQEILPVDQFSGHPH